VTRKQALRPGRNASRRWLEARRALGAQIGRPPRLLRGDPVRRARALLRLVRIDTPMLWRLAAHAAVLVITAGVFVASRGSDVGVAEAATREAELARWAFRVGRGAREMLPQPVLGTEQSAIAPARGASTGGPGFIAAGLIAEANAGLLPWDEPQRYIVKAGDTITTIALEFGIDPETVLFANPDLRGDPHRLAIGQEVTILPVNGVLHVVEEGDTLASIAEKYEADAIDIVTYGPNGVGGDDDLVAGAQIVVPGGTVDIEIPPYYRYGPGSGTRAVWASDGGQGPVAGSGNFYTASYGRISQWFHRWHPAIDIANSTGTPIYAVDGGTVEVASWYGWAGNAIIVDHGNGFESLYAHLSRIDVGVGQTVQKGQIIGGMGCTYGAGGRCTGSHLHLELFYQGGRVNPCAYGACP